MSRACVADALAAAQRADVSFTPLLLAFFPVILARMTRTAAIFASLLLFAVLPAVASANYPHAIPNGYSSPGVGRCNVCHIDPLGGGARTAFGTNFEFGADGLAFTVDDHVWNAWLAQRDSDNDGWSNGQELGDPFARWPGIAPAAFRSLPGAFGSEPFEFNLCSTAGYSDCDPSGSTCTSSVFSGSGDWTCGCATGYTGFGNERTFGYSGGFPNPYTIRAATIDGCVDVNECLTVNRCGTPSAGSCFNLPGSYFCSCSARYELVGNVCVDRNECTATPGICGVGSCSNSIGSYSCSCPGGYAFNGTTCVVTDACLAGTDDCSVDAACAIVAGAFFCTCNAGYIGIGTAPNGTGDLCADNDECSTAGRCGSVAGVSCTNLPGTYRCSCPSGYTAPATGGVCADVNECTMTPGRCGVGTCTNTPGSFTCACPAGYLSMGGTCVDINECATNPCGTGICTQTAPPGYACACPAGYTAPARLGTCSDVDECLDPALSLCSLNATCANSVGSFTCTCNAGYAGLGNNCIDVDECADPLRNECNEHASCTNSTGSYDCMCDAGWMGTGFLCEDVDDCMPGMVACGVNEVCVNNIGAPGVCECATGTSRPTPGGMCMAICGDGLRTIGESCDDANTSVDDGCDARCDIEAGWACREPGGGASVCEQTCGDGLIDTGEECDDAAANSDTALDACRTTCRRAACNDGVLDTGEECDDGDELNSGTAPNACRRSCQKAFCGDGVVDSAELCDVGGGSTRPLTECAAPCVPDAGMPDAGRPDAGVPDAGIDAGAVPPSDDGGCGCRISGASSSGTPRGAGYALLIAMGAIALSARRRRRER